MKIRHGYVSNSSSSSFVIVTPEDYRWEDKIDDAALKELYKQFPMSLKPFKGQKVKVYQGYCDSSCGENSLYSSERALNYCNLKGIDIDEQCEFMEQLYWSFIELFDESCLYISVGD